MSPHAASGPEATDPSALTPLQIGVSTMAMIGVTAVAGLPTLLTAYAGQEGWISALIAVPAGLVPLVLLYDLDRRQPGLTLVQHARRALGPIGGLLLSLPLLMLLSSTTPLGAHQQADIVGMEALRRTPTVVVVGLFLLVPLYAARQGREVLARLTTLSVAVAIGALLLIGATSLRSVRGENLQPVFALGWVPLLQGAAPAAAWYAETAVLGLLLPFRATERRAAWAAAAAGLVIVGLQVSLVTAWDLSIFGPLADQMVFALFQVTRVSNLAEFLTHMDSILIIAWVAGEMARMGLWLYCLCLAFSQWLGLRDYRPLTLPVAAAVAIGACTWFQNASQFNAWVMRVWPFWGLALGIGSPLLVWLAVVLRGTGAGRRQARPAAGSARAACAGPGRT